MCLDIRATYLIFLSNFEYIRISLTVLNDLSNIKFNSNPCSWSQVIPCERMDRRTNLPKLLGVLNNFANTPNRDP